MSRRHVIRSRNGTIKVICPVCHALNSEKAIKCEGCGSCLRCEE